MFIQKSYDVLNEEGVKQLLKATPCPEMRQALEETRLLEQWQPLKVRTFLELSSLLKLSYKTAESTAVLLPPPLSSYIPPSHTPPDSFTPTAIKTPQSIQSPCPLPIHHPAP